MKEKKTSRTTGTRNGSMTTQVRIILADQKLKNKLHNAILHGSVLGAVLAIFGGICYIDTNMLAGAVIAALGMGWLFLFYIINDTDVLFKG